MVGRGSAAGNALAGYFDAYPEIADAALTLVEDMHASGEISEEAVGVLDIDACLGFMLPLPPLRQRDLSRRLRLCREAVDLFNRKRQLSSTLKRSLARHVQRSLTPPLTPLRYTQLVSGCRQLSGTLHESYARSVARVYYRAQLLATIPDAEWLPETQSCVVGISAFLLFDDDVVDLQNDVQTNKETILSQFLVSGGSIDRSIQSMRRNLRRACGAKTPVALQDFARAFDKLYAGYRR
jgi:hypothetical protein